MDPQLTTLLVALVGPTGLAGIAAGVYHWWSRRTPPAPPVAGDAKREAAAELRGLVIALVDAQADVDRLRTRILQCVDPDCPTRADLIREDPT